ncbi:alcohol dehydrogenase catalytic domain-containing protein [Alkalibacter rhizosphaerae]|uniref:Alcohol dehydrogenase catalytic domain-containing protein n=1 Tax=Alkalibacter rhizosphaerae TaxID=2815577 RepID=A0A975AJ76_9FIRM|nr:alcohol dehydrogenase catalytic domain-containing protein [Alkalibacter rhizosphaerae]QSX09295.1 alcohol dehydrogenase catalytic domain-containing protein [Alkalibacter rhizosphaerae]
MNTVQTKVTQLIKPYRFELVEKIKEKRDSDLVIRPTLACICAADLRYYTGNRRPEALEKKLPMALLHEGIGVVLQDSQNGHRKGDRVVIVPNIPGYIHDPQKYPTPEDCCVACKQGVHFENHCSNVHFLSSGYDGMTQDRLVHPGLCAVKIPETVPDEVAVLSELVTVCYNAAYKAYLAEKLSSKSKVLLFGDGPVGYCLYAVLHHIFHLPKENIHVVGKSEEKLVHFKNATTHLLGEEIPGDFALAFECVGGKGITQAADIAIRQMLPGGMLVLMGVSEEDVPINTRDVLEKGLHLIGSSRSSRINYKTVMEHMEDPDFQETLLALHSTPAFVIKEPKDLNLAFDFAASKDYWGKIYLALNQDQ